MKNFWSISFLVCAMSCTGPADRGAGQALSSRLPLSALVDAEVDSFVREYSRIRTIFDVCADCTEQPRDVVLNEVATQRAAVVTAEDSPLADAARDLGDQPVRDAILAHYRVSNGIERLACLQLLLQTKGLNPARFSDDDFQVFFDVNTTQTERDMLLELHRVTGVSADLAENLSEWCISADTSRANRMHCLAALGHPGTAEELANVYQLLATDETSRSLAMRIGDAVGRCGVDCEPLMLRLVTSEREWERQAAYFAAARAPEQAIRDILMNNLDLRIVSEDEEPYVERALGLNWRILVLENY